MIWNSLCSVLPYYGLFLPSAAVMLIPRAQVGFILPPNKGQTCTLFHCSDFSSPIFAARCFCFPLPTSSPCTHFCSIYFQPPVPMCDYFYFLSISYSATTHIGHHIHLPVSTQFTNNYVHPLCCKISSTFYY